MAWNEPGSGNRDPWKNRKDSGGFDDILRRLRDGLGGIFGNGGNGGGSSPLNSGRILLGIVLIVLVLVAVDCWKSIDAQHVGVVLRFGKFNRVMHNGLNLKWPSPIERMIPVETTSKQTVDEVRMLTRDENIVQINFTVQYSVVDAEKYLFSTASPDETLKQAAESAVRQVIGSSDMDTILSSHGSDMTAETKKLLQATLDGYAVGISVSDINFQNLTPPAEVKAAFDDVNNANNDQKRLVNEAQAYAANQIPLARGDAAQILTAAEGYKAASIAAATGETQRFSQIQAQYRAAPEVTRKRLYLESMQSVLSTTQKVVDQSNGKSILYLPLEKARGDAGAAAAATQGGNQ